MSAYVIGDLNTVEGFRLMGFPGRAVETEAEAREALDDALNRSGTALLLIGERWADALRDRVDAAMGREEGPVVLEVPGPGRAAQERPSLRERVRSAVGIRIGAPGRGG
ncbi:MAG: V-type ATP synthase subunit F [Candidatus Longimicrobiales bacterium M2_2A_002]